LREPNPAHTPSARLIALFSAHLRPNHAPWER
jgi:hypothetical protein